MKQLFLLEKFKLVKTGNYRNMWNENLYSFFKILFMYKKNEMRKTKKKHKERFENFF